MLPDRSQYGLSATRDIAHQYSSVSYVSLRSFPQSENTCRPQNVIIIFWFLFCLRKCNYEITKSGKCLLTVYKYRQCAPTMEQHIGEQFRQFCNQTFMKAVVRPSKNRNVYCITT